MESSGPLAVPLKEPEREAGISLSSRWGFFKLNVRGRSGAQLQAGLSINRDIAIRGRPHIFTHSNAEPKEPPMGCARIQKRHGKLKGP
jgi:hypothetical protein